MCAKIFNLYVLIISFQLLSSCTSENEREFDNSGIIGNNVGRFTTSDIDSTEELFLFDVLFNEEFLNEASDYDDTDEDLIENTNFTRTVSITFSDNSVSYDALPEGVSASISGADIVINSATASNIIYQLFGSSQNGMFKLYSDKKCAIKLSNLTLKNDDGPAINIQTKKRTFICLDDNSTNLLADGTAYIDTSEDAKGVIFSEGQVVFNGNGRLTVNANCKAGISSDQYLRFRSGNVVDVVASNGNAIRGKDSIIVSGGVLNVSVNGQGNKGMKSDGQIKISGGRTTIINSADSYYNTSESDTKGSAGVNCDSNFQISGGELHIKATGKGGKGITADGELLISGGKVRVITTGTKFTYGSSYGFGNSPDKNTSSNYNKSPKGIHSKGTMIITDGDIMSRTTGGNGSEGIESKATLTISGGEVQAYSYDDAINSSAAMYLSGGQIYSVSSNNDGLDSNGNMYISGGSITSFGLGEDGVDVIERGTLNINGGTLFSLGNTYMTAPSSSSTQASITKIVSGLSKDTTITLKDNSSATTLFNYKMPLTISRAYMILTVPSMKKGNSYTLYVGSSSESVSL